MMSAAADGHARSGPSATAVDLFQLATLVGVALLAWFQVDPSGHPALLATAATIIGGSTTWVRAASV